MAALGCDPVDGWGPVSSDLDIDGLTTRGDLLRRADAAITSAERGLFSARRPLLVVAWSAALLAVTAVPSIDGGVDGELADECVIIGSLLLWWAIGRFLRARAIWRHLLGVVAFFIAGVPFVSVAEDGVDDTVGRIVFTTLWTLVAVICARRVCQYVAGNRRLSAEVDAWVSARRDPALRRLHGGDVVADVATVHDVRDWPDHDSVVADIALRHQLRQQTLPVVVPFFVLMLTGFTGLGVVVAAVLGAGSGPWIAAAATAGIVTFVPLAQAIGDLWHTQLQRAAEFNRAGTERTLYAVRREHTAGAAEPAPLGRPRLAQAAVAVLASGWIGLLAVRMRTSSGLAILIAAGIVLVVATVVGVRMWSHGRRTHVFPLAGVGPSVLQEPARQVELALTTAGLTITDAGGRATPVTIALEDILAIEPLTKLSVITGRGVGIVTTDAPVVLSGRHVDDDPAVVELRRRLST